MNSSIGDVDGNIVVGDVDGNINTVEELRLLSSIEEIKDINEEAKLSLIIEHIFLNLENSLLFFSIKGGHFENIARTGSKCTNVIVKLEENIENKLLHNLDLGIKNFLCKRGNFYPQGLSFQKGKHSFQVFAEGFTDPSYYNFKIYW